jgi:hypothetical protein
MLDLFDKILITQISSLFNMVSKNRGFYLPEELIRKLEIRAKKRYASANSIARLAIADFLEKNGGEDAR